MHTEPRDEQGRQGVDQTRAMSRTDRLRSILRYDLPSSLVVFLVALPLSLGITIASGATVLSGLVAAVVGGIIVGVLGGSPLQVSGPAAGLTVVVAELISDFGWAVTCLITVAAGVLQVSLGLSRVARAALAISPVVVHAMLAGIGITIALQQSHVLLGGKSESSAWHNVIELPGQVIGAHRPGVLLGVLVIAILVAWRWVPAKFAYIPGPLVAIVGVTIISVVFPFHVRRIELEGSPLDALQLPDIPDGEWSGVALGVINECQRGRKVAGLGDHARRVDPALHPSIRGAGRRDPHRGTRRPAHRPRDSAAEASPHRNRNEAWGSRRLRGDRSQCHLPQSCTAS
jgi:carbonic anhydrase